MIFQVNKGSTISEVAFRKKLNRTIQECQEDLGAFMVTYNRDRTR